MNLTKKQLKTLKYFFQLKEENLLKVMYKFLSNYYTNIKFTKDYILAIGNIPVALAAHLDTVFKYPPDDIFYDREQNVLWSPEGLGADDRAGLFIIIELLKRGYRPTIILTMGEESGAIGARALVATIPEVPTELKYIIQLDRRGVNDCVFYDCENKEFKEYVESFGFKTAIGSFTDISTICPVWKVAGVNLSVGYFDEHSVSETLYVTFMLATLNKVEQMLLSIDTSKSYEYIEGPYSWRKWLSSGTLGNGVYKGWDFDEPSEDNCAVSGEKCFCCNLIDFSYNMIPVKTQLGTKIHLCLDCMSQYSNIEWCEECGEAFLFAKDKPTKLCPDCEKAKLQEDMNSARD